MNIILELYVIGWLATWVFLNLGFMQEVRRRTGASTRRLNVAMGIISLVGWYALAPAVILKREVFITNYVKGLERPEDD